ncbi:MAG: hypothetical protein ABIN24_07135 [Dyadobacter sp.]
MQRNFIRFKLSGFPGKRCGPGWLFFLFQNYINICIAQESQTAINIHLPGPVQGLPGRNTRSLSQDGQGFMWVTLVIMDTSGTSLKAGWFFKSKNWKVHQFDDAAATKIGGR